MGQKINPTGFRVGVIKDWESAGTPAKRTSATLLFRTMSFVTTYSALLAPRRRSEVEIERDPKRVRHQHSLR